MIWLLNLGPVCSRKCGLFTIGMSRLQNCYQIFVLQHLIKDVVNTLCQCASSCNNSEVVELVLHMRWCFIWVCIQLGGWGFGFFSIFFCATVLLLPLQSGSWPCRMRFVRHVEFWVHWITLFTTVVPWKVDVLESACYVKYFPSIGNRD